MGKRQIIRNKPTQKSEWIAEICRNVRLAHCSVRTICDNVDIITESSKWLDKIKFQQSKRGTVCLCNKTTTVLSESTVTKTMDVSLLQFHFIRNK